MRATIFIFIEFFIKMKNATNFKCFEFFCLPLLLINLHREHHEMSIVYFRFKSPVEFDNNNNNKKKSRVEVSVVKL